MRLRALGVTLTIAVASAGTFAACSSFEEDPTPPATDSGSEDAVSIVDGGTEADAPDDATGIDDAGLGDDATTILAQGLSGLVGVAVTDADEVVVALSSGQIRKMPLLGGNDGGTTLVLQNQSGLSGIAMTGAQVMFATSGGIIGRSNLDGSGFASKSVGGALTSLVTLDTTSIFAVKAATGVEVRRYHAVDLNPGEGYASQPLTADLAIAGVNLYWTDSAGGAVWTGTTNGNPAPAMVQTGETGCTGVAADLFGVYWLTPSAVRAKVLAGGPPKTIASDSAIAVAARDGTVYWLANAPPGRLRKADLDDDVGPRQTLASGFALNFKPSQKALALTASYVVWITSDGRVMRHDR